MSRVTVFERTDASSLYVEWWDDEGRHKRALATIVGEPITDKELAKEVARRMSAAQERRRNQHAAEMLGLPSGRSLKELLQTLHMDRAGDWSKRYRKDQERYRDFWLEQLGDVRLTGVSAAIVERIAARAYADAPSARKHALRYIVDAFYYAQRKLKWLGPQSNLSGVTMPKRKKRRLGYSLAEAKKLVDALGDIDARAEWIARVALQTGRRLTAIRTLPQHPGWADVDGGTAILRFPVDTDKADAEGIAVVAGRAAQMTARILEDGWETPPMETCQAWIREAEELAGVEHVKGRAWHGFKRLWATLAKGHPGREQQGGTTRETLDRVYVQDELDPKLDLAKMLAARFGDE